MYKIDFNIQEKKLAIQIPLYTREEQRSKRWKVSMCNCYKLFISVSFMDDFFFLPCCINALKVILRLQTAAVEEERIVFKSWNSDKRNKIY